MLQLMKKAFLWHSINQWQRAIWDYFGSLPPLPEGYARKWYITRKGVLKHYDIPPSDLYRDDKSL